MIKSNDKQLVPYNGNYKPVNVMSGRTKIAGYKEEHYEGKHIEVEDTYNDLLKCKVKGKHSQESRYLIDWNQYLNLANTLGTAVRCTYNVTNNIITLTGLDTEGVSIRLISIKYLRTLKAGDKILVYSTIYDKSSNIEYIKNYTCWNSTKNINAVSSPQYSLVGSKLYSILTMVNTVEYGDQISFYLDTYTTNNTTINLKDEYVKCTYNITNLTQAFGAGNEPTIEECRKMFPCDYYPYCASEYRELGKGAWVNFNQLVKDGNKEFKLIGNSINYYIRYNINNINKVTTINHKYYFAFNIKLNTSTKKVNSGLHWDYSNYDFIVNITNKLGLVEQIVNCSKETPLNTIFIHQPAEVPLVEGEDIIITNYNLIDLTQMFGTGNEPTTIEEFKALYPNEYYEYCEGRYEDTIGFYDHGPIVENTKTSGYKSPCPEYPEDITAVSNPKIDVSSKGVMWNQLIEGNPTNYTLCVKNDDGSFTINGTTSIAWNYNMFRHKRQELGHIYVFEFVYISGSFNLPSERIRIFDGYGSSPEIFIDSTTNLNSPIYCYKTKNTTYNSSSVGLYCTIETEFNNFRFYLNSYDLTTMFGEGNEPTLAEFKSMFPKDYYPYDAGTLRTIKNLHSIIPTENEIPFTLYGDGVVNDEVEPCVLIDGEWKCRVTRRWWKSYMTNIPLSFKSAIDTYNTNRSFCFFFNRASETKIYAPKSNTTIYSNMFKSSPTYTLPVKGYPINTIQQHTTQSLSYNIYASITYDAIGIPKNVTPESYAEIDEYLKTWASDKYNNIFVLYQLYKPVIELYPPINVRTLPINSVVDCTADMEADIKVIDRGIILPEGYTELGYIESTGTQYIDTLQIMHTDYTFIIKAKTIDNSKPQPLYGAREYIQEGTISNTNFNAWCGSVFTVDNARRYTKGSSILDVFVLKSNNGGTRLNDTLIINYNTEKINGTRNIILFGINTGGNIACGASRIYRCKMFNENNVLILDLIPCTNPQGEVGMFDLVSQTFFGNSGTGTFIAGNPV